MRRGPGPTRAGNVPTRSLSATIAAWGASYTLRLACGGGWHTNGMRFSVAYPGWPWPGMVHDHDPASITNVILVDLSDEDIARLGPMSREQIERWMADLVDL